MRSEKVLDTICHVLIVAAPGFGFLQALAASLAYVVGLPPQCSGIGCDEVSFHPLAYIGGVPVAYFGLAYYLLLLALGLVGSRNLLARRIGTGLATVGVLVSIYLLATLRFRMHLSCDRCSHSAISSAVTALSYAYLYPIKVQLERPKLVKAFRVVSLVVVGLSGVQNVISAVSRARDTMGVTSKNLSASQEKLMRSGYVYGSKGPVIVVFVDMFCGACHLEIGRLKERIDAGEKFQLSVLNYPLKMNSPSSTMAIEASSGPASRFWGVFDACKGKSARDYESLLRSLETVSEQDRSAGSRKVDEHVGVARALGIDSTPSMFLLTPGRVRRAYQVPYMAAFIDPVRM